jgi:hypothetical protein
MPSGGVGTSGPGAGAGEAPSSVGRPVVTPDECPDGARRNRAESVPRAVVPPAPRSPVGAVCGGREPENAARDASHSTPSVSP